MHHPPLPPPPSTSPAGIRGAEPVLYPELPGDGARAGRAQAELRQGAEDDGHQDTGGLRRAIRTWYGRGTQAVTKLLRILYCLEREKL